MKATKISIILTALISININSEVLKLETLDLKNDDKAVIYKNDSEILLDLNKIKEEFKAINETPSEIDYLKGVVLKIDPTFEGANFTKLNELEDFYEVSKNNKTVYIHKSGNYIIPVIAKITNGEFEDIQKTKKRLKVKEELLNFPNSKYIEYKAENPIDEIYVFSDYTCPYCKRFHSEISNINKLGITINYIPYPRNGLEDKDTVNGLKNIICSKSPTDEFNRAFDNNRSYTKEKNLLNCTNGDDLLYNTMILGEKLKIAGTPSIFLKNGSYLGGWTGLENFKTTLQKELLKKD